MAIDPAIAMPASAAQISAAARQNPFMVVLPGTTMRHTRSHDNAVVGVKSALPARRVFRSELSTDPVRRLDIAAPLARRKLTPHRGSHSPARSCVGKPGF